MPTRPQRPKLSFIIPALNEERNISNAILSIQASVENHDFEIIIVDNGSEDATRTRAENLGAKVLERPELTIAALRNEGFRLSNGCLLIFIDADVTLGPNWEASLEEFWNSVNSTSFVTGNTCTPTSNESFISKYWFQLLKVSSSRYINTGHLITTRELFSEIGGFNPTLSTAEDVDFCERADQFGARIIRNPKLIAFHHGYPGTFKEFILREAWHGQQDTTNIKTLLTSKTASAALCNSALLISGAMLSLITNSIAPVVSGLILSQIFCFLLTFKKFGAISLKVNGGASLCFQAYLLGRTLSPAFDFKSPRKR